MALRPLVSVIMPVYNGELYLREAIESILNQTYINFELLIINDGSTDRSEEIIKSYHDPRIKLINNEKNLKLIASLNKGMTLATGKYIARMDSDDISLPQRLEIQVNFMEENHHISVCGTWVEFLDEDTNTKKMICKFPTASLELKYHMLFRCSFIHPSVMMRASDFQEQNIYYDSDYPCSEDFELWNRINDSMNFYNIPRVLLQYRVTKNGISRKHYYEQKLNSAKVRFRIYKEKGIEVGDEFYDVSNLSIDSLKTMERNIKRLRDCLEKECKSDLELNYIGNAIFEEWYELCRNSTNNGFKTWLIFYKSDLTKYKSDRRIVKLLLKSLLKRETTS
jgi:glycosyltransferase involved in cell wall biosynthesis